MQLTVTLATWGYKNILLYSKLLFGCMDSLNAPTSSSSSNRTMKASMTTSRTIAIWNQWLWSAICIRPRHLYASCGMCTCVCVWCVVFACVCTCVRVCACGVVWRACVGVMGVCVCVYVSVMGNTINQSQ